MIPKIAYFHWSGDGPTMSWLRTVSIVSFAKFNPEWEIRLIRTPQHIRDRKLKFLGQEADWSWWEALLENGGFQVATDIVFVNPVPGDWLKGPLACNTRGSGSVFQFAMLGCERGNEFMRNVVRRCYEVANGEHPSYQAFGTEMLQGLGLPPGPITEIPMSALCHYDHTKVGSLWFPGQLDLPQEAIGVHWYGGHELSKAAELAAGPNSDYAITDLAKSVMPKDFSRSAILGKL